MEWRDQVAVVTGGARGLGRATARILAQRGAAVPAGTERWAASVSLGRADVSPRGCPAVISPAAPPGGGPLHTWRGLPAGTVPARPAA
jgi:NAD(P)-dependent dehydrogenase (short-subunit alcohol dehydrogenase family)